MKHNSKLIIQDNFSLCHTLVPKKKQVLDMSMGKFTLTFTHYPLPEFFG